MHVFVCDEGGLTGVGDLEIQSKKFLEVADELEKAAAHARTAAKHFKSGEVPRGCAHAFATEGHILAAADVIKEAAKIQAQKSAP